MDSNFAYQRCIHLTFKLNGLGADSFEEVLNDLNLQDAILYSLHKIVANFIRLD